MKIDVVDVSPTQKQLTIEIPSDAVDAEIDRVAKAYTKSARLPGFRPGKVPVTVVRQRFKAQILHDAAREIVPRAMDEAMHERGLEPVDAPDIGDFAIDPGQPLTFTAAIETVPPFDPGELSSIVVRRPSSDLEADALPDVRQPCRSARAGHAERVGRVR